MDPLDLVRLAPLMALTRGRDDLVVGLVDGPVALEHPDLAAENVRVTAANAGTCHDIRSAACRHGTFVAGILAARRGAQAPAIAPDCTLLVRPIFTEATPAGGLPGASPEELVEAIAGCVDARARILNLSVALSGGSMGDAAELREVLAYVARRGVLVVAAAGNQGAMGGSTLTRHPWVIPVVAYGQDGLPRARTNLAHSIGGGGLGAPGEAVVSLAPEGRSVVSAGTSVAAPFVTGAAALLWSMFPDASAGEVRQALVSPRMGRRRTVAPPLLDAWAAYVALSNGRARRAVT